ncbi:hypothetical protein DS745_11855 [Anaerobacillus alkaliphilus]|uniref:Uncharacterized protein n=1 Tax=Anaerobacillus alkaliphilus TaxID=1548597 RepID=A0A4Q0VRY4_9BACI|nr:hypothetical protein DS745_11855 [Anaerobacillus alkaliphilus]
MAKTRKEGSNFVLVFSFIMKKEGDSKDHRKMTFEAQPLSYLQSSVFIFLFMLDELILSGRGTPPTQN